MLRAIGFDGGVRRERLVVQGRVRPTALSSEYLVQIEYRAGDPPKVWLLDPPLRGREDGTPVPHVYRDPDGRERPCLYDPRKREWEPRDRIATTIVPWLMAWLCFYEDWLITGEWRGGGEHPERGSKAKRSRTESRARWRRGARRR